MPAVGEASLGEWRRDRLGRARLYLVMEAEPPGWPTAGGRPGAGWRSGADLLSHALEGGVDVVQLRDKSASDGAIVEAGRAFRRICHEHGALFVVNDRADLALACQADGVHVGQEDSPIVEVRRTVGPDVLIGQSTHTAEQIVAAGQPHASSAREGSPIGGSSADYLGVGPVYETATKPGRKVVGPSLVSYAAVHAAQPFFAIGGIDGQNVAEVAAAGAQRVAVVRAIRDAADPRAAAAELRAALEREAVIGTGR